LFSITCSREAWEFKAVSTIVKSAMIICHMDHKLVMCPILCSVWFKHFWHQMSRICVTVDGIWIGE
jgi:hypothetical protein